MKILITGSNGFIGKNLFFQLKQNKKYQIFEYNKKNNLEQLEKFIKMSDVIFHFAGVNRGKINNDFKATNIGLTEKIIKILNLKKKTTRLIFSSTNLIEKDKKSNYSKSKLKAEILIKKNLSKIHKYKILRLPNIFGKWSKPNYNSVVATFCYNISRNIPIKILKNKKIQFIYIDDLVNYLIKLINYKSSIKNIKMFDCKVDKLAKKIYEIKKNRFHMLKNFTDSQFNKYLYSTYLTYIPTSKITYKLKAHNDKRGDFIELFKYPHAGQISYFTVNPNSTRGGHYHNTKVEKFFLVSGNVEFSLYNLENKKKKIIKLNSKENKILETIPGYVHIIKNKNRTTAKGIIWSNEIYNKKKPDTIYYNINEK